MPALFIDPAPCKLICIRSVSFSFTYIITVEPTLEEYKFDFNSDEPLEEQEVEGNKRLRECCVVLIEVAREEREARVEEARIAHQAKMHDEKELRLQLQVSKLSNCFPCASLHFINSFYCQCHTNIGEETCQTKGD